MAVEVARRLRSPLDVLVVRKLGMPGHEELALGALASGPVEVLDEELMRSLGVRPADLNRVRERELKELVRREREYRGGKPPLNVRGIAVVVVDDGAATGATMRVAIEALRSAGAGHITVAVPVASQEAYAQLEAAADEIVCMHAPAAFQSVGQWYKRFGQTTDTEVRQALQRSAATRAATDHREDASSGT